MKVPTGGKVRELTLNGCDSHTDSIVWMKEDRRFLSFVFTCPDFSGHFFVIKEASMDSTYMKRALTLAKQGEGFANPNPLVGAVIVKNGRIIGEGYHEQYGEPHAEINAIRQAGKALGTHDMSGCTLYTTAYPCPMCLGATIWANIKHIIYGCRPQDADALGFRDDFIYEFFKKDQKDESILVTKEAYREECLELFKEYKEKNKQLY